MRTYGSFPREPPRVRSKLRLSAIAVVTCVACVFAAGHVWRKNPVSLLSFDDQVPCPSSPLFPPPPECSETQLLLLHRASASHPVSHAAPSCAQSSCLDPLFFPLTRDPPLAPRQEAMRLSSIDDMGAQMGGGGCSCCGCMCNSSPCAIPSSGTQGSEPTYWAMMSLVQQLLNRQPLPGPPGPAGPQGFAGKDGIPGQQGLPPCPSSLSQISAPSPPLTTFSPVLQAHRGQLDLLDAMAVMAATVQGAPRYLFHYHDFWSSIFLPALPRDLISPRQWRFLESTTVDES